MRGPVRYLITLFAVSLHLSVNISHSQNIIERGSVLFSHVSPDFNQATDEFVVLYNPTADTIDLEGYEIRYLTASGSTGGAGRVFSGQVLIPPARHLLLSNHDTLFFPGAAVLSDEPFSPYVPNGAGLATEIRLANTSTGPIGGRLEFFTPAGAPATGTILR